MKIAIPRLALAQPLLEHAAEIAEQYGFTLIEASLEECGTMLLNNNVDESTYRALATKAGAEPIRETD